MYIRTLLIDYRSSLRFVLAIRAAFSDAKVTKPFLPRKYLNEISVVEVLKFQRKHCVKHRKRSYESYVKCDSHAKHEASDFMPLDSCSI